MAQENSTELPLIDVISSLEKQFPYTFTYANDTIEDIYVLKPPKGLSLEETLDYLEKNTPLIFTIIPGNFISVNKGSNLPVICGTIKGLDDNSEIQSVVISTVNGSTITNEKGYFQLEVQDTSVSINIGHLAYRVVTRSAGSFKQGDCEIIYLEPKAFNLQEVLLTNYITKGIGKTANGQFTIDYSDFGILPGLIEADVLQTIQALPGVQSADETVSNINIRGGTHDQNLILWDGIKMYQSGHFFGLISVFNPNITSRATLIKNGTSAEYGDGVSGTILMNSDNGINQDFSVGLGVNMINIDGFADIPIGKKSSLQLSARKAINEFWETETYAKYFDRISQDNELGNIEQNSDFDFDFYDTNLRWNYELSENDKIRVNFLLINNDLVFKESAIVNSETNSRQSSISQSSIAGGIWYQRRWNERFRTSLQIYETDYDLQAVNADISDSLQFLQKNKVSETGAKLNTLYKLNTNINLLNGYQFIETGITNLTEVDNPVFIDQEIRVIRTHGLFSELSYKSGEKRTLFNFGLRYTYNDKFRSHILEPRISFSQKIGNYFNLEALGEFKHQNTSQIIRVQNDFLGIEKRRWVLADGEKVPVVMSKQGSLGIQYRRDGWLTTAEGYYKEVDDITVRSQGFENKYSTIQAIGSYTVYGLDFLVNKRYNDISTWLSYSYADNDYTFPTLEDVEFPNNIDITHAVTFGASYELNNFKVSAGLNWNSGLPTTSPLTLEPVEEGGEIDFGEANRDSLKEYFRFDMSASYKFGLSKGVKAHTGVSVWNITNNKNIISNYYTLDNDNIPNKMTKSALGVTPNVVLRVLF